MVERDTINMVLDVFTLTTGMNTAHLALKLDKNFYMEGIMYNFIFGVFYHSMLQVLWYPVYFDKLNVLY